MCSIFETFCHISVDIMGNVTSFTLDKTLLFYCTQLLTQLEPSIYIPLSREQQTLMLRPFGVSQEDAVSVLGTLNKDNAVVPDIRRAAIALESWDREGEGWFHRGGGRLSLGICAWGLTDIVGNVTSFTPACSGARRFGDRQNKSTIWTWFSTNNHSMFKCIIKQSDDILHTKLCVYQK